MTDAFLPSDAPILPAVEPVRQTHVEIYGEQVDLADLPTLAKSNCPRCNGRGFIEYIRPKRHGLVCRCVAKAVLRAQEADKLRPDTIAAPAEDATKPTKENAWAARKKAALQAHLATAEERYNEAIRARDEHLAPYYETARSAESARNEAAAAYFAAQERERALETERVELAARLADVMIQISLATTKTIQSLKDAATATSAHDEAQSALFRERSRDEARISTAEHIVEKFRRRLTTHTIRHGEGET